MKLNPLNAIDFYKTGHIYQYPEGTEMVYSNFTPRSGRLYNGNSDKVVFFGLQGFIKWFLQDLWKDGFFNQPKEKVVAAYKRRMDASLGPDSIKMDHIESLHDLGYLPIQIKALPEGSRVPFKVPVLTVRNTIPEFYWLVNYLETALSAELWKSCTIATIAAEYKNIFTKYAVETGSPVDFCSLQGHDFSARGQSGFFDASQNNAGHLLSFVGTDTVASIDYLENYYGADAESELIGCSVPASEHSVMTMEGPSGELELFRRLITEVYPTGIVSLVADGFDFWKVLTEYTVELKDEIMSRQPNTLGLNKVVFRPDSGDPVKILAGYKLFYKDISKMGLEAKQRLATIFKREGYDVIKNNGKYYEASVYQHGVWLDFKIGQELSESEVKGAVEVLWNIFGGTTTEKGYKVLDEHVGLIYGDSITLERAEAILSRLKDKGFASCNVVFGIGSYTYQYNTRDTFGFAMKATYGVVNGEGREIFKDPATDKGTKKSAKGMLRVEKEDGTFILYDQQTEAQEASGELQTVFLDGKLHNFQTLSEIRQRLANE